MKAYLVLSDGSCFEGKSIGKAGAATGECVFTTAMVGYMETLTDPSYYGQIVMQTFPLIGNYGALPQDAESRKSFVAGYVVRELVSTGSNFRLRGQLNEYLCKQGIVGIEGVDTRMLTRKIREGGVMNGMIAGDNKDLDKKVAALKAYRIKDAVRNTTIAHALDSGAGGPCVVLWDLGAKENIARELRRRGCRVVRVPSFSTAEEILSYRPDGVMLSNGPGDPAENKEVIAELKKLNAYKIPTFGICLGHQLMALAAGGKTKKLKYGHRGANQPVCDVKSGRTYITSQNHGYAVLAKSVPEEVAEVSFRNANDGTCEGMLYKRMPAFTVQFHPEACGGPHDTDFLFDRFIDMMRGNGNAQE